MSIVNFEKFRSHSNLQFDRGLIVAKHAKIYGVCALASLVLFLGAIPISLILGMCAVSKSKEAYRLGVKATPAKAMGIISIIISGSVFIILSFALFLNIDDLLHHN